MIYESVIVLRSDLGEDAVGAVKDLVAQVIGEYAGEVLITDSYGVKTLAQPTARGITKGNFIYFMFKANSDCNKELDRRFRINDGILRFMTIKLGEVKDQAKLVKAYKKPGTGDFDGQDRYDVEKDRRLFAKRKSCWFTANKTAPDWKDPLSYAWLVNEFGKISPARVTGLTPKFQRKANAAIKRGRCIGLISFLSNEVAH